MFSQEFLTNLFPPERTNDFFEALFGAPEDGAYDIKMSYQGKENKTLKFYFELHARPNQCLRCNLTTGLPPVFERHPIIAAKAMAEKIAEHASFANHTWKIGQTIQYSEAVHYVPLYVTEA